MVCHGESVLPRNTGDWETEDNFQDRSRGSKSGSEPNINTSGSRVCVYVCVCVCCAEVLACTRRPPQMMCSLALPRSRYRVRAILRCVPYPAALPGDACCLPTWCALTALDASCCGAALSRARTHTHTHTHTHAHAHTHQGGNNGTDWHEGIANNSTTNSSRRASAEMSFHTSQHDARRVPPAAAAAAMRPEEPPATSLNYGIA